MKHLYLSPSEIRYSQDSINNVFDNKSNYRHTSIGETLDDLCEGRRQVEDIPTISVVWKDGYWFTLDNRRLWVFRHLERLRKCTEIPVKQSSYIPEQKFTTDNDGKKVVVRGNPGGSWYKKNTPPKPSVGIPTFGNLSEMQTRLQRIQPSASNQNRRGVQHTAAKDICIAMNEQEIHATKTTPKFSDSSPGSMAFSLYNNLPTQWPQNRPRIQSAATEDVCITMEEPEVPVAAIKRQPVPVTTRQIPKDVHKSKEHRCCVIL